MMRYIVRLVLPVAVLTIITGMLPVLPTDIGGVNQLAQVSDVVGGSGGLLNGNGNTQFEQRLEERQQNSGGLQIDLGGGLGGGSLNDFQLPGTGGSDPFYYQIVPQAPTTGSSGATSPTGSAGSSNTGTGALPSDTSGSSGATTGSTGGSVIIPRSSGVLPGVNLYQNQAGQIIQEQFRQQQTQVVEADSLPDLLQNSTAAFDLSGCLEECEEVEAQAANECQEKNPKQDRLKSCLDAAYNTKVECQRRCRETAKNQGSGGSSSGAGNSSAAQSLQVWVPETTNLVTLQTGEAGRTPLVLLPSTAANVSLSELPGYVSVSIAPVVLPSSKAIEITQTTGAKLQVEDAGSLLDSIAVANDILGREEVRTQSGGTLVIPGAKTTALSAIGRGVVDVSRSIGSVFSNISDFFGALVGGTDGAPDSISEETPLNGGASGCLPPSGSAPACSETACRTKTGTGICQLKTENVPGYTNGKIFSTNKSDFAASESLVATTQTENSCECVSAPIDNPPPPVAGEKCPSPKDTRNASANERISASVTISLDPLGLLFDGNECVPEEKCIGEKVTGRDASGNLKTECVNRAVINVCHTVADNKAIARDQAALEAATDKLEAEQEAACNKKIAAKVNSILNDAPNLKCQPPARDSDGKACLGPGVKFSYEVDECAVDSVTMTEIKGGDTPQMRISIRGSGSGSSVAEFGCFNGSATPYEAPEPEKPTPPTPPSGGGSSGGGGGSNLNPVSLESALPEADPLGITDIPTVLGNFVREGIFGAFFNISATFTGDSSYEPEEFSSPPSPTGKSCINLAGTDANPRLPDNPNSLRRSAVAPLSGYRYTCGDSHCADGSSCTLFKNQTDGAIGCGCLPSQQKAKEAVPEVPLPAAPSAPAPTTAGGDTNPPVEPPAAPETPSTEIYIGESEECRGSLSEDVSASTFNDRLATWDAAYKAANTSFSTADKKALEDAENALKSAFTCSNTANVCSSGKCTQILVNSLSSLIVPHVSCSCGSESAGDGASAGVEEEAPAPLENASPEDVPGVETETDTCRQKTDFELASETFVWAMRNFLRSGTGEKQEPFPSMCTGTCGTSGGTCSETKDGGCACVADGDTLLPSGELVPLEDADRQCRVAAYAAGGKCGGSCTYSYTDTATGEEITQDGACKNSAGACLCVGDAKLENSSPEGTTVDDERPDFVTACEGRAVCGGACLEDTPYPGVCSKSPDGTCLCVGTQKDEPGLGTPTSPAVPGGSAPSVPADPDPVKDGGTGFDPEEEAIAPLAPAAQPPAAPKPVGVGVLYSINSFVQTIGNALDPFRFFANESPAIQVVKKDDSCRIKGDQLSSLGLTSKQDGENKVYYFKGEKFYTKTKDGKITDRSLEVEKKYNEAYKSFCGAKACGTGGKCQQGSDGLCNVCAEPEEEAPAPQLPAAPDGKVPAGGKAGEPEATSFDFSAWQNSPELCSKYSAENIKQAVAAYLAENPGIVNICKPLPADAPTWEKMIFPWVHPDCGPDVDGAKSATCSSNRCEAAGTVCELNAEASGCECVPAGRTPEAPAYGTPGTSSKPPATPITPDTPAPTAKVILDNCQLTSAAAGFSFPKEGENAGKIMFTDSAGKTTMIMDKAAFTALSREAQKKVMENTRTSTGKSVADAANEAGKAVCEANSCKVSATKCVFDPKKEKLTDRCYCPVKTAPPTPATPAAPSTGGSGAGGSKPPASTPLGTPSTPTAPPSSQQCTYRYEAVIEVWTATDCGPCKDYKEPQHGGNGKLDASVAGWNKNPPNIGSFSYRVVHNNSSSYRTGYSPTSSFPAMRITLNRIGEPGVPPCPADANRSEVVGPTQATPIDSIPDVIKGLKSKPGMSR